MNFNKIIAAGYLTRDCDLRFTPKGTAVAQSAVALNRRWKDESGESKEEVTFVEFTAFGKTAETMAQYLRKGAPVLIDGRLRQEVWEDKRTGDKRSKLTVVVETFQFLEAAVDRGGDERGKSTKSEDREKRSESTYAPAPELEDSIPF